MDPALVDGAVQILRVPLSLGPPAMVKVAVKNLLQLKFPGDPAMVIMVVIEYRHR